MMEVGKRPTFGWSSPRRLCPWYQASPPAGSKPSTSALSVDHNDLQNARMVTYYSSGSQLAVRPPAKKRFNPQPRCGRKIAVLDGSLQYAQLVEKSANRIEQQKKTHPHPDVPEARPWRPSRPDGKAYGTLTSPIIENAVRVQRPTGHQRQT